MNTKACLILILAAGLVQSVLALSIHSTVLASKPSQLALASGLVGVLIVAFAAIALSQK